MRKLASMAIAKSLISLAMVVSAFAQTDIGDIVVCIDASGSMRFPFPASSLSSSGYTCTTLPSVTLANSRYDIVRRSIQPSISALSSKVIGPPNLADGNIAIVRFPLRPAASGSGRVEQLPTGAPPPPPPTPFATWPVNSAAGQNPFTTIIPSILDDRHDTDTSKRMHMACNPDGTPMGEALILAKSILDPIVGADPSGDEQAILLITDGENNRSPYTGNPITTSDAALSWLHDGSSSIRVDVVGIGDETGTKYDDLALISQATGGRMYAFIGIDYANLPASGAVSDIWWATTSDDPTVQKDLRNELDFLFLNYLHYTSIFDPRGVLSAHEVIKDSLLITTLDRSISVAFHWNPERGLFHPILKLMLADGFTIAADSTKRGNGYHVVRGFDYAYVFVEDTLVRNQYGLWRLQIDGSDLPTETPYSYSIYTQSNLRIVTDFERAGFHTGDQISGELQLQNNGSPVTGAIGKATIAAPVNWVGNWNHAQKLTADEAEGIRHGNWMADLPLLSRKRIFLRDKSGTGFIRESKLLPLQSLSELGGVYRFTSEQELTKPGLYEINYEFTGTDSEGRQFKRQLFFHKYASVNIDSTWEYSNITFDKKAQDGNFVTADVNVVFKDKFKC
jgi:hypothetical protein